MRSIMASKFLCKVNDERVYDIRTTSGKHIKVSVSIEKNAEGEQLFCAYVWNELNSCWKLLMNESVDITCSEDLFVKKVNAILSDE